MASGDEPDLERYRDLVQRLFAAGVPAGEVFDAARAVVRSEPDSQTAFKAMCMLLEGALADPAMDIEDTQVLVPLLKNLARGTFAVGDLL